MQAVHEQNPNEFLYLHVESGHVDVIITLHRLTAPITLLRNNIVLVASPSSQSAIMIPMLAITARNPRVLIDDCMFHQFYSVL
jgi:hypothetical protein